MEPHTEFKWKRLRDGQFIVRCKKSCRKRTEGETFAEYIDNESWHSEKGAKKFKKEQGNTNLNGEYKILVIEQEIGEGPEACEWIAREAVAIGGEMKDRQCKVGDIAAIAEFCEAVPLKKGELNRWVVLHANNTTVELGYGFPPRTEQDLVLRNIANGRVVYMKRADWMHAYPLDYSYI